jgi:hypothetical protein
MEHVAPIILALVAVMGAAGAVGKFIWVKVEKRLTLIESALDECEKRELDAAARRQLSRAAMELLWQELKRIAPKSPVLARAKKLMDEMKDVLPD